MKRHIGLEYLLVLFIVSTTKWEREIFAFIAIIKTLLWMVQGQHPCPPTLWKHWQEMQLMISLSSLVMLSLETVFYNTENSIFSIWIWSKTQNTHIKMIADVCNPHPGMSHMTKPQEFYANVMSTFTYLDNGVLPEGSHLLVFGESKEKREISHPHTNTH